MITEVGGWYCLASDLSLPANIDKLRGKPLTTYQAFEIFSTIGLARNFRRAIDVGANYGLMSYHLSKNFEKVESFELDSNVRQCLELNVKRYNMSNVTIHPYGCGPAHNKVKMLKMNDHSFSTRVDPQYQSVEDGYDAEVVPLDSYDWDDVDLIKIDAEGFEGMIIQGAQNLIARSLPVILYEKKDAPLQAYGHSEFAPLEMLSHLGYRMLLDIKKNGIIGPKQKKPIIII